MKCRHCHFDVERRFVDLGASPPSNAYLKAAELSTPEAYYPLRVSVCTNCWLVQTEDFAKADQLFNAEYAYFSSVSQTWLEHAAHYTESIVKRLGLDETSLVMEIAANDGYLLKNFVERGIPCVGIEPTMSTAIVAESKGIPIIREFFGREIAAKLATGGKQADLIAGNNVYAHVPDINDFTDGLQIALKQGGTVTLEFPHVLKLIELRQFDTIYHEHFSYLSLHAVRNVFAKARLRIFDVEKLPTHGGSLRIYGCHSDDPRASEASVDLVLTEESEQGLLAPFAYDGFQSRANEVKNALLKFLIDKKILGKSVAAYGAAAKGNTLLNYGGVKPDLLPYVCDASTSKQGKFMPGSRIPIFAPSKLRETRPDYVLILPWNIADEVVTAHGYIREWGGRFVVAVPTLRELL